MSFQFNLQFTPDEAGSPASKHSRLLKVNPLPVLFCPSFLSFLYDSDFFSRQSVEFTHELVSLLVRGIRACSYFLTSLIFLDRELSAVGASSVRRRDLAQVRYRLTAHG
jgi:hypothetical protein